MLTHFSLINVMFYELNIYNNFTNVFKYTVLCTLDMWWVVV